MKNLEQYLDNNLIQYTTASETILTIKYVGKFALIQPKNDVIILPSYDINLSTEEESLDVGYYCFKFGDEYYYSKKEEKLKLNILKYIGKAKDNLGITFPFLGIHGGYELLNGSRLYNDWVKKSKFLGYEALGIVEKNTLGGVLKFQLECQKNKIKPIIGEQVTIKDDDELIQLKCYVKNKEDWKNLLLINKAILVDNNGFIEKKQFLELASELVVVIDPKYVAHEKSLPYSLNIRNLYYQIDTVEFENDETDKTYLLNVKKYLNDSHLKPVLISDAYYLDKEDSHIKSILNTIGNSRDYKTVNQYLKSPEEQFLLLQDLFEENRLFDVFEESVKNAIKIGNICNFTIDTGKKYLTEYIMTNEEYKKYNGDKDKMFWELVEKGLNEKVLREGKDIDIYIDRVQEEYPVIKKVKSEYGDGIDYFLILLRDIVDFSKDNGILVGLGRGSAAGSLISYLLDITKIDPIEYNLLFSRFLNEGRVDAGKIPDIDIDVEALRRNEVKRHIENKYGHNHLCSVGTFTTLQIKAALKDIARQNGIDYEIVNKISQKLDIDDGSFDDIFKSAMNNQNIYKFIKDNPDTIENIRLVMRQPKSNSVHACATIITPKDQDIFTTFPVRLGEKDGETIIVSEWEGGELEDAGFLKEDILGITQLDKYRFIIDLIKSQTNEVVDIYSIPVDNGNVYELFKKGYTGDVFHFGSTGLTGYCKEMKPDNIQELIAAISLYRPGAMDVNSHNEYILRKYKEKDVVYHWNTDSILSDTYGLIVYQEQVMEIFQKLADFTPVMADDVRRAMGKKKAEILNEYKDNFISTVTQKGCPHEEAVEIWKELEVHSRYSFNRSHAASYAMTGYIGQWLKYHYPLQYWTSAFQFDNPDPKKSNIGRFISEIKSTDNFIKISSPDINESAETFTSNYNKMELYWSINKVKQVGDVATKSIIEEREKDGDFYSLEEFLSRINKSKVNKAVVINLILSGAFDRIENIKVESERQNLIKKYYDFTGTKRDKDDIYNEFHENYWWQIKQKELCGIANIGYREIVEKYAQDIYTNYKDISEIEEVSNESIIAIAGIIKDFEVKTTKKGDEYCRINLDSDNESIDVLLWNDFFITIDKEDIETNKILIIKGKLVEYRGSKAIHSLEDSKMILLN